jgi:ATP-dependent RNA helicase SUPV3L1/SUV3
VAPAAEIPVPAAPAAEGEAAAQPAKPAEPQAPAPTPEQTAIIVDLHWLIHQGAVLEFADGRMETAKKPAPKPVKQEKKPAAEKPAAEGEAAVATETTPPTETAVELAAEISAPAEPAAETAVETPAPAEVSAPVVEPAGEADKPAA